VNDGSIGPELVYDLFVRYVFARMPQHDHTYVF
jgi:hypothetical protein